MAQEPQFAVTPRIASVTIATANANRDGTGTIATLISGTGTAGAGVGTRVAEIVCKARGVTTAGMVRVFLHDGTNFALFDEITIGAVASPGASTPTTRVSTMYTNLVLPSSSWSVRVSTHNAESIDVTAFAADL